MKKIDCHVETDTVSIHHRSEHRQCHFEVLNLLWQLFDMRCVPCSHYFPFTHYSKRENDNDGTFVVVKRIHTRRTHDTQTNRQ